MVQSCLLFSSHTDLSVIISGASNNKRKRTRKLKLIGLFSMGRYFFPFILVWCCIGPALFCWWWWFEVLFMWCQEYNFLFPSSVQCEDSQIIQVGHSWPFKNQYLWVELPYKGRGIIDGDPENWWFEILACTYVQSEGFWVDGLWWVKPMDAAMSSYVDNGCGTTHDQTNC